MTDKPGGKPSAKRVAIAATICAAIALAINAVMAVAQFRDHFSWGAIGIMIYWSPIANGMLLAMGVALTPLVRLIARGASVKPYLLVAILLPLALIGCQLYLCILDPRERISQ